jgi:hypothetical protein
MNKLFTTLSAFFILATTAVQAQCTVTYSVTQDGLSIAATAVGSGATGTPTYAWDFGDGNNTIGEVGDHTFDAAGTYEVCVYYVDFLDPLNCQAQFCQEITVSESAASITTVKEVPTLIKPNPFVNQLEISSNESLNEVVIVNALGTTVYRTNTNQKNLTINTSDLARGVYFVRFNGKTKRLIKE